MTDKDPKIHTKNSDQKLWQTYTQDIKPLKEKGKKTDKKQEDTYRKTTKQKQIICLKSINSQTLLFQQR